MFVMLDESDRAGRGGATQRAFAPEAHMPRNRRLLIEAAGVVLEVDVGVQHRIAWADCEAVLRFPDRLELVFDPANSLVIRASDWFHGEDVLTLADGLVPPTLLVEIDGVAEDDPTPYVLTGLARHSAVVVATALLSCSIMAALAIGIGMSQRRGAAVLIGLAFCIPVVPLMRGIRRRLSVPRRWRGSAVQGSPVRVRFDARLSVTSERGLRTIRILLPVLGVLASFGWWMWTGNVPVVVVTFATGLSIVVDLELRRRRHR